MFPSSQQSEQISKLFKIKRVNPFEKIFEGNKMVNNEGTGRRLQGATEKPSWL
jgi:hypothetical protein